MIYPDKHPSHDWAGERDDGQAECAKCGACTDCDPATIVNAPCPIRAEEAR